MPSVYTVHVQTHNAHNTLKIMQIRVNKMALCSQFNALHLCHSSTKNDDVSRKSSSSNEKLMQKEIKLEWRFLAIWFANANGLPFDAYGFNLGVFFSVTLYFPRPPLSLYKYSIMQMWWNGNDCKFVVIRFVCIFRPFSSKRRHLSSKRNKRIILSLFFRSFQTNPFIHCTC